MWASLIVDVYVEREGVFVLLVMMGLLGVVVGGVGLVSIMDCVCFQQVQNKRPKVMGCDGS